MSLQVFTSILGHCDDPDTLIISRKQNQIREDEGFVGGHRTIGIYFSPSGELQKRRMRTCGFKLENETDQQWRAFADAYREEMRKSYVRHRQAWKLLLSWQRVVIVSRETEAPRSARTVLAQFILPTLGAEYRGEI